MELKIIKHYRDNVQATLMPFGEVLASETGTDEVTILIPVSASPKYLKAIAGLDNAEAFAVTLPYEFLRDIVAERVRERKILELQEMSTHEIEENSVNCL